MFDAVRALRESARRIAAGFDPGRVSGADAAKLVREWAAIEHIAATMKALAAARVGACGAWQREGAPSAADWLARLSGTTASRARDQLATAERLERLPATAAAARRGDLSPDQVAAIADAAASNPAAEPDLLDAATTASVGELRSRCQAAKAAADADPEATARRLHADRRLRRWGTPDGAQHLHASGPPELLARIDAALRPLTEKRFQGARREGRLESPEAYAFDALVDLADRSTAAGGAARTRHRAVLRVDWTALVRGRTTGDETCEIAGLGPIPVTTARELLGDATLHLVVTKGVDVANVTYLGRGPNAAQRIALLWQMPACSRLGCNRRARLQVDHRTPYAEDRVTELANLDPLCEHDHRLKTTRGWALVDGTGKRLFVPPDHPDHPRNARGGNRARAPDLSSAR